MLYPMRQAAIEFPSDGQPVDGILATPVDARPPFPGAVICHAHPLFGGQMDSPIMFAIASALAQHNVASVRFNFRPFGEDATEADGSAVADAFGALRFLQSWHEIRADRCGLVGYSAGAAAVARGFDALSDARAVVLIAPPPGAVRSEAFFNDRRPRLIIAGSNDRVSNPDDLRPIIESMPHPAVFHVVADADHTLAGHEAAVAERVAVFLGEELRR